MLDEKQMQLDTQQKERLGLAILKSALIADNIEIATPERDNGIDLIIYKWGRDSGFKSAPVQMKSASDKSFSIDKGYELIPNLFMAYVWNILRPSDAVIYFMSYQHSVQIGNEMGWTNTKSWTEDGEYSTTAPSKKLIELMERHRVANGFSDKICLV